MSVRILVVEDDPVQQKVLAGFLETNNFYVETSADGLDALRRGRLGWFDVIILDHQLPEINGLSTAKLISEFGGVGSRPTMIALTATTEFLPSSRAQSGHVFDAVLHKPWHPKTLLETIARCHEKRRSREDGSPTAATDGHGVASAINPVNVRPFVTARVPKSENAKVLVVDDDEVFQGVLAAALVGEGYEVETAASGIEGFRMISTHRFDVAILDYNLPEIDGLAIARLSHDLIQNVHRPRLVALTSSPEHLEHREAGSLSAFDFVILKSGDLSPVFAAVELSLRYRRLRPNTAGVSVMRLTSGDIPDTSSRNRSGLIG